jgi:hypothetical protein
MLSTSTARLGRSMDFGECRIKASASVVTTTAAPRECAGRAGDNRPKRCFSSTRDACL